MQQITFRDDDVEAGKNIKRLQEIHEVFKETGLTHTIGLVVKDIEKNKPLIKFLTTEPNLQIQFHGYEHIKYKDMTVEEIEKAIRQGLNDIARIFNKSISTFYPPWNETSENLHKAANNVGINVDINCVYAGDFYYRKRPLQRTIYFHHWVQKDIDKMKELLREYKNGEWRIGAPRP